MTFQPVVSACTALGPVPTDLFLVIFYHRVVRGFCRPSLYLAPFREFNHGPDAGAVCCPGYSIVCLSVSLEFMRYGASAQIVRIEADLSFWKIFVDMLTISRFDDIMLVLLMIININKE